MFSHFINEETGVMTFEWILLVTMVVIGVVAGMSTIRDTTSSELNDISTVTMALEQSYGVKGLSAEVSCSFEGDDIAVTASSSEMSHQNGKVKIPTIRAKK